MPRRLALALAVFASLALPAVGAQAPQEYDGLAAVVNNFVYTKSFVRAVRQLRLLDGPANASDAAATVALVERHLVLEEVARYAMPEAAADAVRDRRREWEATLPPGFDLAAALKRDGLTEEDLAAWHAEDVRIRAYLDKLFSASAQPTAFEIATYVRDHAADLVAQGAAQTPGALEAAARRQLAQDNRTKRVREWIDALKRRADIAIKIK
jgi:hypothetical protein